MAEIQKPLVLRQKAVKAVEALTATDLVEMADQVVGD